MMCLHYLLRQLDLVSCAQASHMRSKAVACEVTHSECF